MCRVLLKIRRHAFDTFLFQWKIDRLLAKFDLLIYFTFMNNESFLFL